MGNNKTIIGIWVSVALASSALLINNSAQAELILGTGTEPTDDLDSDGNTFNIDNSPFVFNPGQEDSDLDGIGDVTDPDDTDAGIPGFPYPSATISAPDALSIPAGSTLEFSVSAITPPQVPTIIQFDFTPAPGIEAYESVVTDLSSPASISIPASFIIDAGNWDLNTPGLYTLGVSLAPVPGLTGSNTESIAVTVTSAIPEPSSALALLGLVTSAFFRRRRRLLG